MHDPAEPATQVPLLIIDDNPEKAGALAAALDGLDLEIVRAASGEEGLRRLSERDYAVILLDVLMPGMDGFETARRIRSRPESEKTPILFVSSFSPSDLDLSDGYSLGAVDYLLSPIRPQILRAKISVFVDLHQKNRLIARQSKVLEQKVIEGTEALRETEERFRLMVEAVREYAIFMLDPEGNFSTWNPGAQRILGYSEADVLGTSGFRIFTPEDIERGEAARELETAKKTGQAIDDRWHVRKDGSRFWASGILTAIRDGSGGLNGYVKVLRDFTEKRNAQEALERSEEMFRMLVEDVRDYAIYMIDPQGIVTSWNNGAERIKGYAAPEILGRSYTCFYTEEDIRQGKPAFEMREAAEKGRYEEEGWRVRKGGALFWGDEVISSIRDRDGALKGFTKVTRDISDRKKAEEASARQLRFLEGMNEISKVLEANLDLESILREAMEKMLEIFACDRAYLARPGYPDADKVTIPFLASRSGFPEPPGDAILPMDEFNRTVYAEVSGSSEPLAYGEFHAIPGYDFYRENFSIRSMLVIALKPRFGDPWVLGVQQCAVARNWSEEDRRLFKELAFRVSATLNNLLFHRNLRESEARFRQLAEGLPQIIWTASAEGRKDYLNGRWSDYTGSPEEGGDWTQSLHPREAQGFLSRWKESLRSGEPFREEVRLRNAAGEYRCHLSLAVPIKDEHGRIWKWVGSFTDVENQKKILEDLRESREQLRTILEGITEAIIVQDPQGGILYLNQAAASLMSLPSPEALLDARNSPEWAEMAPSFFDEHGQPLPMEDTPVRQAMRGVEAPPMLMRYRIGSDTREKWIISRSRPIFGDDGKVRFIISITQDITEIRKAEAELRQSQKMEAIGRLAGGIAHDFNNLLTAINGYSELGLEMAPADAPLHPILQEILEAGKRAAALTNQLLAHSRQQLLTPRILDLNDSVRNMHTMLNRLIGEDIDLATVLDPEVPMVRADPGQIEQVILNLVLNARDAMPKGGKITIETRLARVEERRAGIAQEPPPGEYFLLTVSDTGQGMAREVSDHIFEPFYTTKDVGKGTGLGLSTVYGIVKQSGGFITVYSEPGHGSVFKLYFPAVDRMGPNVPAVEKAESPLHAANGETILLVEDEDTVRKLSGKIMSDLDYRVLEAGSGDVALELARNFEGSIDLLLTDVVMGGIPGPDLAARIRELRPDIKVIYMSGYTNDSVIRHGIMAATSNFIQKPFSPKALARKVAEVLSGSLASGAGTSGG